VGRKGKFADTAANVSWSLSEAYRPVIDSERSRDLDSARADFVQFRRVVDGGGLNIEQRAIINRFEAARFAADTQFRARMATSYRAWGRPSRSATARQQIPAPMWKQMDLAKLSLNMVCDPGGIWWRNVEVEPVGMVLPPRAQQRWKLEAVVNEMRLKIERKVLTIAELTMATEERLARDYGASRTTVRAARKELISRLSSRQD
jgi:hypothetical protein